MFKSEIKSGVRVIDTTTKATYTWVRSPYTVEAGLQVDITCKFCSKSDVYMLAEDVAVGDDGIRYYFCIEHADIQELQIYVKKL